ncbi:MAG: hypothetical protein GY842_04765, partial [bacterium]|nr:hypothetical protein [bacterium]
MIYFLGWGPGVAPAGRDRPPYRLAHSGYYVTPGEELIFQSGRADRSFRLASLGEGERLALTAQPTEGSDRLRWTLRAEIDEIPLRVDGRQINLPAESWFQPGDQLVVRDLRGDRFFSVRWLADPGRSGAMSNRYLYNQGQLRDGNSVEDLEAPLLISQRLLREGYRLSSLAGSGIAEAIDRLRQPDRERRSSWLGSLFGTAGEEVPKLTAGVDVDAFEKRYRGLAPLFRQVLWLRQNLGDPASPMGVHLAGDLRDQDLYEVLRVRPGGQSHGLGQGSVGLLERALDPGSRVRLGFGSRDSVVLRPGATVVQDSRLGLVADLRIGNPASWPFPETQPAEVMIMSREILAQVHGFHLDVGLDREPFYAKVRYVTADDRFEVHDGKDLLGTSRVSGQPPSVFAGKRFRLGGFQRGVVLHFADQRSPVRFSGRWAMLALLVANVLFSLSWRGEASSRPKLDLAWTLIWGLMLTFLVVRLILAFRVAVLPPEDASPALIRTVFEQSLIVSLGAVWLVPPVVVGARLLARISWTAVGRWLSTRLGAGRMRAAAATRIRGLAARLPLSSLGHRLHPHGLPLPPRFLLFACLLVLWLSAAVVVGRNEALAGLRINIVVHLLLAFGLAAAAGWLVSARWTGRVLFLVLWFAVPTVVVILLIGDTGFGIHFFSFLLVALLLLPWGKQYLRWWAWVVLGVLVVGVVLPLAHPQILTAPRIDRWITKAVNPASHHVYYRLAVRGSEDELLRRRSEEAEYDLDLFLRNSQQQWQMLLYASEGLVGPRGYGGAPLSRAGMTYPSSLTDCVYSIYLLAEHGSAAAVLLVLAYAAMGALMIHGGWFFVDRGRHSHRSRLLVLTLVGGYFALNTLYMALANLGELVFTGQNIPLLALYSRSDILASAFLLCLVSFLLRFRLAVSDDQALPGQPLTRRFGYAYIAVFAAGVGLVALQMQTLAGDHSTRSDFSFPEATLDEYRQNLPEPGKAKPLQLDRRALRIQVQGKLSWVEEQYVRKFNHQLDKFDPVAGLYYLVSPSSGPQLQINGDYFNLPSPFRKRSRWEGTIEAQGPELPTLNLLGEEVVIQPMVETPGETFSLTDPPRDRVRLSNRVVLAHGSGPEAASLIELLGDRQTLSIDPYQPPPWMKWEIHVDGEEVTGVSQIRPLEKGQIIRITGSQSGTPFAYNLIYLGPQRPLLAFSTWRNGKTRRVLAEGSMAGTLRELGLVLDREKARHTKLPERLLLTLDAALHRRLEGIL